MSNAAETCSSKLISTIVIGTWFRVPD